MKKVTSKIKSMKRKIFVTTGSRAEYGFLRPLFYEICQNKKLELYIIVAGMHLTKKHGMSINEIKKDGFKIHDTVTMIPKGNTVHHMAKALGEGILQFSDIFHHVRPDINLVLGDRDEMLASTIAATHMNIPNAHIHGGDKSGGIDESNRHAITKFSHIHFAVSKNSMKRIIKMGENQKFVFFTGSPSIDEVLSQKITTKKHLEKKYNLKFTGNEILFLQHSVTTQDRKSDLHIRNTLTSLFKTRKNIIAISPNSDAGHKAIFNQLKKYSNKTNFKVFPNLPREDYLGMLKNCAILVGNSSSGIIEASYFDTPVVDIGIRQKNRDRGKNVLTVESNSAALIYKTLLKALKMRDKKFKNDFIYGKGNASKKICRHLESIKLDDSLIQKEITY